MKWNELSYIPENDTSVNKNNRPDSNKGKTIEKLNYS